MRIAFACKFFLINLKVPKECFYIMLQAKKKLCTCILNFYMYDNKVGLGRATF